MMAYVTVEDDTAAIEMLVFSKVLNQFGGYLKENSPVVITGRLSIRDEKEPQIVVNRARPISDFADCQMIVEEPKASIDPIPGRLYLSVGETDEALLRKVRAIVQMFPGNWQIVLKYQQTGRKEVLSGSITEAMLREMVRILGTGKVFMFVSQRELMDGRSEGACKEFVNNLKSLLGEGNVSLK
jgi:DNA polymerase-3 subunit alpha